MQWRKRQIWQSNNLNITDLEVEYVDNGYIDELVQGSRPFSLSHTLDSSDSLLLGDDDPPTASSPRDNKPEIYFEITILMKQSHWNCGLGLTNGRIQRLNEMADWDENAYYMEDNKYHKGHESWSYLTFRTGDTVGCGVIKGRLFFTKNGRHLGVAH
ncbi:hypothetical protein BZA77DRAFT_65792 [Pyronema omphalodes]|nr:hypothetical protein BZA77DRAFT_65792 [Pyronema omphalodes]